MQNTSIADTAMSLSHQVTAQTEKLQLAEAWMQAALIELEKYQLDVYDSGNFLPVKVASAIQTLRIALNLQ